MIGFKQIEFFYHTGTKTASDSSAAGHVKRGHISRYSVVADTSKRFAARLESLV